MDRHRNCPSQFLSQSQTQSQRCLRNAPKLTKQIDDIIICDRTRNLCHTLIKSGHLNIWHILAIILSTLSQKICITDSFTSINHREGRVIWWGITSCYLCIHLSQKLLCFIMRLKTDRGKFWFKTITLWAYFVTHNSSLLSKISGTPESSIHNSQLTPLDYQISLDQFNPLTTTIVCNASEKPAVSSLNIWNDKRLANLSHSSLPCFHSIVWRFKVCSLVHQNHSRSRIVSLAWNPNATVDTDHFGVCWPGICIPGQFL